jgi:hypothetical protein
MFGQLTSTSKMLDNTFKQVALTNSSPTKSLESKRVDEIMVRMKLLSDMKAANPDLSDKITSKINDLLDQI